MYYIYYYYYFFLEKLKLNTIFRNVTLDHKTVHKGQFYEVEIIMIFT